MSRSTKKITKKNRRKKTKQHRKSAYVDIVTAHPFVDPVSGLFDIETLVISVPPCDADSTILYLNAHQLIPYDYRFDPIGDRGRVEAAATTLQKKDAAETELLRAIVLLGHSPCDTAIKTLTRWSNSDHHYASVARVALSECQSFTNLEIF